MVPERFGCIREIDVDDEKSWRGRIFLTLDVDWAHDDVIAFAADILEDAGAAATWFATHDTPVLRRLMRNPRFELGIHPNFNFLLDGDQRNGANCEAVLDRLLEVLPGATSVRSHSMTQSSRLLELFTERGLTHDCNHFIPFDAGLELKPWRIWNNLIKVPYCWEDDLHCVAGGTSPLAIAGSPGFRVFDFHPIHVFLNTEELARYESARPDFNTPDRLHGRAFGGAGTRTWLEQVLEPQRTG